MTIDMYKTFIEVAKTNSFSRTAENLNVVQSTVTSRIQELEKYLDKELFVRNKRRVSLSNAGIAFLPYAKKIIEMEREGIEKLQNMAFYQDKLTIGVSGSIYRGHLSSICETFYSEFPQYAMEVIFQDSQTQIEKLIDRQIDLGIIDKIPITNKLIIMPYLTYDMVLVAAPDYDIESTITVDQLHRLDLSYVLFDDVFNKWIENLLPKDYVPRLRINGTTHLIHYAQNGHGCAFVPRIAVESNFNEGTLREIKLNGTDAVQLSTYLAINKERFNSPSVQDFLSLLPETPLFG